MSEGKSLFYCEKCEATSPNSRMSCCILRLFASTFCFMVNIFAISSPF